ncbi:MAG: S-adenosyl-L-methionine-dependent methyltransferase [Monoraphidium minutum]|nr:MAG: S-adenosyl-L-methionine-dependent methyltransferase [Monoraphidium minutum]
MGWTEAGACLLALALWRKRERRGDDHPAPEVSASGKIIAAWRALESLEPDALLSDPFAADLAGPAAVAEARRLAKPYPPPRPGAAGSPRGGRRRRFCYSNVGVRVWWFDAQLMAALGCGSADGAPPPPPPATAAGKQGPAGTADGAAPRGAAAPPPPRQVVVLGAGFDARPWRLALPEGVAWFEVDLPEVVAAKRAQLQRLGAALAPAPAGGGSGGGGGGGGGARHPLRAASWAALSADLQRPGWSGTLLSAGLDAAAPTVWVAEGLLMYLTEAQVDALLQEMAAVSPAGSRLVMHHSTRELLELRDSGGLATGGYGPFPAPLVATWRSGFPPADAPAAVRGVLAAAGWPGPGEVAGRAGIAARACARGGRGGGGKEELAVEEVAARVDVEARPHAGGDRWAVFFTAGK